jgi:hypothetical protein
MLRQDDTHQKRDAQRETAAKSDRSDPLRHEIKHVLRVRPSFVRLPRTDVRAR